MGQDEIHQRVRDVVKTRHVEYDTTGAIGSVEVVACVPRGMTRLQVVSLLTGGKPTAHRATYDGVHPAGVHRIAVKLAVDRARAVGLV